MEDDIFSDLIGQAGFQPLAKQSAAQPQLKSSVEPVVASSLAPPRQPASGHAGPREPVLPEPDLLDSALTGSEANGTTETPQLGISLSKDELQDLVQHVVATALDSTMSKFVRSLRTVLEDMGRRIETTGSACIELRDSVDQLKEQLESQGSSMHARFTSIDLAVKEVERGVQSLRDKQELLEAQAMLAKLSTKPAADKAVEPAQKQSDTPASTASASTSGAASAPVAPAAAPAAPAPAAPAAPPAVAQTPPVTYAPAAPQAPVAPPPPAPAAPPAAVAPGVPAAPPAPYAPMAPPPGAPPPPPQQQPQPQQFAPPPGAPYISQGMSAPPAPPVQPVAPPPPYQQPPSHPQPPQQQSSSYMSGPPSYGPPQGPPQGPPPGHPMPHMSQGPPAGMYGPPPGPGGPQYPAPPAGAYPAPYRTASGAPPHHGGPPPGARPGPQQQQAGAPAIQQLSLDKVVNDIVAMGFSHGQVMNVVRQLQATGQPLEMNVIIDRLMR